MISCCDQDMVTGGSCRFCGSLKAASEMNLSYEVEVSQLTSGGTKALRPSSLVLSLQIYRIVLAALMRKSGLSRSHNMPRSTFSSWAK